MSAPDLIFLYKTTFVFIICLLTGCSTVLTDPTRNRGAGSGSIFQEGKDFEFSTLNYCDLLKDYKFATKSGTTCTVNDISTENISDDTVKRRRNELTERIVASSTQKCAAYQRYLTTFRSRSDLFLGALTTLFAGAGAVITSVDTAQGFSALAAASSGIREEVNSAYFLAQTLDVISKGIDQKRAEKLIEVRKKYDEDLKKYPLTAAINDALEFHSYCNVVAGISTAGEKIDQAKDPGLAGFNRVANQLGMEVKLTIQDIEGGDK